MQVEQLETDASWAWKTAGRAALPDAAVTVSEWADKHRYLSTKASAEPGRWRTSRTPYLREIMDNLSAYSSVETTVLMKGAQLGASEAALNFKGYCIHHAPGPGLYVMPTIDMAKKISKTRIDPMIEASPALAERISPARAKDSGNSQFSKEFAGGVLMLTGANSASGLRSMPIRYLALDEVDGYPVSADKEGDPVNLALVRTTTFVRRKIFMLSTPTEKATSRIGKAFRDGDQRYYHVACEGCGSMQPILWKQIKWPKGEPDKAVFVCKDCHHEHTEYRKTFLMDPENGAQWIATAESKDPGTRSYHLSSLYSPWKTWAACAREFIAAHGIDGRPDPSLLQVFVNTVLGEEWEEDGESVNPDGLLKLREDWGAHLPARAALLTAGIDVQPDRIEVETVAWGRDEESWGVDYEILIGDPEQNDVWERLDALLRKKWKHPGYPNGISVQAACIDTGGSNTARVYKWAHANAGRKFWAIKGSTDYRAPIWPKKPSRTQKSGTNFYMVGVSAAKDTIYKRLSRVGPEASGAGACHFSMDWDEAAFAQLTAETKRIKFVNGFKVPYWWKPDGARNERLDCRVYAYAALKSLVAMGLNLNQHATIVASKVFEEEQQAMREPVRVAPPADAAPSPSVPPPEVVKAAVARAKPRRRIARSSFM